ncbi:MAG TPA: hypothetical protein DEB31_05275 [Clostridiales bacterium]|nr:hypothetical protein [Clostridiales bacterium]
MNTADIVGLLVLFILAIASFIISYRQFKEKGFLFNNAYVFASKDERKSMDKKPYYRQSAIVFLCVGIAFSVMALCIVLRLQWLQYIALCIFVVVIVYAIVSSIKNGAKRKQHIV